MAKNADEKKPASTSKLMYVLMFLMLGLIAINTWLLWDTRANTAVTANPEGTAEVEEKEPYEPVFLTIKPFTVNLENDQFGPRLLYAGLTLELPNDDVRALLDKNMPQVRNRLLVLLSGKNAEQIAQSEGKQLLAQSIANTLSEPYNGDESIEINKVLFTEFIVQ
ncbi:hypothetical protein PSI9734_01466 [Pseudidiomarina piscicola]|uniref:Flagellar protein FliL n=1 Tax=Pseudidiomarina piscicola TaxID=2614830 RepID=A0A6S6WJY9_9GAMM|nr:flagellar basal body-associated FliL family protein [Pseudidiomarina piscicola]CAB0151048.1 hypothetical protein PSI9734_01466 [Pseudidiomarina piscicola]VZT40559.1 hypothetical protein PSI9734_01466 [Pseudomonas aeruginosa]